MKKQIKYLLAFILAITTSNKLASQSSITGLVAGHAAPPIPALYWNGWDAGTTIPFNLDQLARIYNPSKALIIAVFSLSY